MNEQEQQKKDKNIQKLVSNARAIISNQVGIPHGCERAGYILNWLRKYSDAPSYPIFEEYLDAVRLLPTGSERLEWDPEKLKKLDKKLDKVNAKYREGIIEACQDIIRRYS